MCYQNTTNFCGIVYSGQNPRHDNPRAARAAGLHVADSPACLMFGKSSIKGSETENRIETDVR